MCSLLRLVDKGMLFYYSSVLKSIKLSFMSLKAFFFVTLGNLATTILEPNLQEIFKKSSCILFKEKQICNEKLRNK